MRADLTGHAPKESCMLTDALKAFCEPELASHQRILEDFETGRRKVGISTDDTSWTDTTANERRVSENEQAPSRCLTHLGPFPNTLTSAGEE